MSLKEFKPAYFTIEDRFPIVVATVTQSSLCDEDNIEQFGVELNHAVDGYGSPFLALDLQRVMVIASSAIGKLISLHRNLHRRDGCLALCGVHDMVQNVLQAAKLIDYFHVNASIDDAVEFLVRDVDKHAASQIGKPK